MDKNPQPDMPLIESPVKKPNLYYRDGFNYGRYLQRDADMVWLPSHDQQVRKDFAEECIKTMPYKKDSVMKKEDFKFGFDTGVDAQYNADLAHLRAMAKEK